MTDTDVSELAPASGDDAAPPARHAVSLVVWDTPSPAVISLPALVKAGLVCEAGCDLTGQRIEVEDATGRVVAAGDAALQLDTQAGALFWTEIVLPPPQEQAVSHFVVRCGVAGLEHEHLAADQRFSFAADVAAECVVRVAVVREDTGEPCVDVEVRLGRYEAFTGVQGEARLRVPRGAYSASIRKIGVKAEPIDIEVEGDMALQLLVQKGETREELEARLSMMEDRPWA